MKALKLRIDDDLYAQFKALHPGYGEESKVFRDLLAQYLKLARSKSEFTKRLERPDWYVNEEPKV